MMKSAPESPFTQPTPSSAIDIGDAAASEGDWPLAIASWEGALHGPHHDLATARLQWFLDHSGVPSARASFRKPVLLLSIAFALLGTALVFIAQSTSGALAKALAVTAWACYVATAVGAVVYAWRTGTASSQPILDANALHHARAHAHSLVSRTEPDALDVRR
jgi:hypothetical protein